MKRAAKATPAPRRPGCCVVGCHCKDDLLIFNQCDYDAYGDTDGRGAGGKMKFDVGKKAWSRGELVYLCPTHCLKVVHKLYHKALHGIDDGDVHFQNLGAKLCGALDKCGYGVRDADGQRKRESVDSALSMLTIEAEATTQDESTGPVRRSQRSTVPDDLDSIKTPAQLPVLFLPDVREHLVKHLIQAFYKWRAQLGDGLYDGFQLGESPCGNQTFNLTST